MRPPKALILCAGRGERLRPHTDHTPKPLLPVHGQPLVAWHLQALAAAGVREVVLNTAWLAPQFPAVLGDGSRWGLRLHFSDEQAAYGGALETAGGMATAMPLLIEHADDPFWVVSGDVFVPGFTFGAAALEAFAQQTQRLAQLWLAPNAPHHPEGDFGISAAGLATSRAQGFTGPCLTWASVGLFRAGLVAGVPAGQRAPLRPHLEAAIAAQAVGAQALATPWVDVGTPERWQALQGSAPVPV
jgi:MurNAc alpha-1-phosphate uridylyltransferase